jgi:hypothetical protein
MDEERGNTEYLVFEQNGRFDTHIMSRPYHLPPDTSGGVAQISAIFDSLQKIAKMTAGKGKAFCVAMQGPDGLIYLNRHGFAVSRDAAYAVIDGPRR